jgi:hypothetical protein
MASKHSGETYMIRQLRQIKVKCRQRGFTYRRMLRCFDRFQVMLQHLRCDQVGHVAR